MKKRRGFFSVENVVLFILIIAFILTAYFTFFSGKSGEEFYSDSSHIDIQLQNSTDVKIRDDGLDPFSNIGFPHWNHMPVTYSVVDSDNCLKNEIERYVWAMEEIENVTDGLVSFKRVDSGGDVVLKCLDIDKEYSNTKQCKEVVYEDYRSRRETFSAYNDGGLDIEKHKVLSVKLLDKSSGDLRYEVCYIDKDVLRQGDPNVRFIQDFLESYPTIVDNKIVSHVIYVYSEKGLLCGFFPTMEAHELLHTFGFAHSFSSDSDLLFPRADSCVKRIEINEKYVSCLRYIYSDGVLEGDCEGVNFILGK